MVDPYDRFTEMARIVVGRAAEVAALCGHQEVDDTHLLTALIAEKEGSACKILSILGITFGMSQLFRESDHQVSNISELLRDILFLAAVNEARKLNHHYMGTGHILLGILSVRRGIAYYLLVAMGVDYSKVYREMERSSQVGS